MGGTSDDQGNAIAVDNSGSAYTTGYYNGTANFNPAGTYTISNFGSKDVFVSCLNSSGAYVWANAMSGGTDEEGLGLSISGTELFVTGYFTGSTDFDRQTSVGYLNSFGLEDIFVSRRYLSTGGSGGAVQLGGTNYERGLSITNDLSGNVLVTGYFKGVADFDPDLSTANLTSTASGYDAFICKLDGTVNMYYIWANKIASTGAEAGYAIKTDALDNVYSTGYFGGTADFDPGAGTYTLTAGNSDVYVSKLTSTGTFVWAKNWGSTGGGDEGKGIALDASGNVYTTGRFTSTCDFDPGAGSYSLTAAGSDEIFVHKLSCTLPSTVTTTSNLVPICIGTSATYTIGITSAIENGVSYSWNSVGPTGISFSPSSGTNTAITYTASSGFSVVVTATNACGTTTTMVQTITPYSLPTVSATQSPTLICDGSMGALSGTGASSYSWSPSYSNGTSVTQYAGGPTYTVTGVDVNGCINTATFVANVVANPTITISGKSTVCLNSSNILTASGASTYTWLPVSISGSTINAQPISSTVYTINAKDVNGCNGSTIFNLNIVTPQTPDICEVTVDSLSQYNNIMWDKTAYTNVDSFIVYREVSTNIYKRIGAQDKNALSLFVDTARSVGPANGDPNITSYRYKLQIRDTCGNYSAKSPWHNTVYFITNTTGTFFWNMYNIEFQGSTPVSTFELVRDNNATGTWTLVGTSAGTSTSLNDPAFSGYPNAIYRVLANGFNCNPTAKTTQQINKTKSNVKNNFNTGGIPTGINANALNAAVSLAPNPATSQLIISFNTPITSTTKIMVTDVLGKVVYNSEMQEGASIIIPVNELSNGVYFVKVEQGKNYTVKKFIKE